MWHERLSVNTLNTRVPQLMLRTPSEAYNEEKSKKVSQLTATHAN